ncbi:MAG: redox-regulated ATPase YchF [Treponema sp.]|jgi:GTP-binding protein YchF|nr:redox-regulated ATPase YchF [Treponema sp.]
MALNCGIVGLPNVGKSTIFSALCSTPVETTKYPSSTVKANIGVINVPDQRLDKLSAIFLPRKTIHATMELVDIAGLAKGSSRGDGLGNQFLSNIRDSAVYIHVVRCFEDSEILHVSDKLDPASDMETIDIELALADMQTLAKRRERAEKNLKNHAEKKNTEFVISVLDKIEPALEEARGVRSLALSPEEKAVIYDCHFITAKPQLYVCNVDETAIRSLAAGKADNPYIEAVKKRAESEGTEALCICGKFEAEIAGLETLEEKQAFLEDLGLKETGLSALIHSAYKLLGLRTFFTTGEDECRAWTIRAGDTAPKAAGAIHTDFEKGFIKAEVYTCDDIFHYGSEAKIREAGKYRLEGKEYIVQDGDVIFFKFNL